MLSDDLDTTARAMIAADKGLLAMDESTGTCNKRFAALGIPQTEQARRAYRELIVTTPGLGEAIGGAILADETMGQATRDGVPFVEVLRAAGIIPGIKVDQGAKPMAGFAGETLTEGLDDLAQRLDGYARQGARFAKWRAVLTIGDGRPTAGCLQANALLLARYAASCQQAGIVPIVEPEVLMDGDHDLARCAEVTERVLAEVFAQLHAHRVRLEGMVLKPNMVLPGVGSKIAPNVDAEAEATLTCLRRTVPPAVAAIAFLSGGQAAELASARLNAMNATTAADAGRGSFRPPTPWPVTFSFSRAVQQPALEIWRGQDANVAAAQRALLHRVQCNRAARRGAYSPSMEASRPR